MGQRTESDASLATEYEDRYVAFVDILGFANIVESSRSKPEQVGRLHSALAQLNKRAQEGRSSAKGVEASSFSDTVVVSAPISADGLLVVFDGVSSFTADLLSMNMLLRGAVVRGKLLHSERAIFGPALVHAYQLESTVSFHPRVMVDSSVLNDIDYYAKDNVYKVKYEKFVVTDHHDVAYLSPFAEWHDRAELSEADTERLIALQAIIAGGLLSTKLSPAVCEKYKWLARKLNSFIRKRGIAEKIALIEVD